MSEFEGNTGPWGTLEANRLVRTASVTFTSAFPDSTADYVQVGYWTNFFQLVGQSGNDFICKKPDPYQPILDTGLNLAFDYAVSLSVTAGTNTRVIAECRADVNIFGGIIEGGIENGGSVSDLWEFDSFGNRVCARNGTAPTCSGLPSSQSESGSVLLELDPAPGEVALVVIEVMIAASKQGTGTGGLTASIDLNNFEWICP